MFRYHRLALVTDGWFESWLFDNGEVEIMRLLRDVSEKEITQCLQTILTYGFSVSGFTGFSVFRFGLVGFLVLSFSGFDYFYYLSVLLKRRDESFAVHSKARNGENRLSNSLIGKMGRAGRFLGQSKWTEVGQLAWKVTSHRTYDTFACMASTNRKKVEPTPISFCVWISVRPFCKAMIFCCHCSRSRW